MPAEADAACPRRPAIAGILVAICVVGIDQVTKSLVVDHLGPGPHHVLGPFGLQLTYNTGSAFSLLAGRSTIVAILDVLIVVAIAIATLRTRRRSMQVGLGLMLGGAIGNLIDRATRHHDGGVVDFITFPHFATFNAADSAITIGVLVVIGSVLADSLRERSDA